MEKMQKILEEDTRVNTALLPVGCGLQLTIKKDAALSSPGRRALGLDPPWRVATPKRKLRP